MKNTVYKQGDCFGNWTLEAYLDSGGNGDVWSVVNNNGERAVIKLLKKIGLKSYLRFKDEIKIVIINKDISGILPILDHYLPEKYSEDDFPWYVMPFAKPLKEISLNEPEDAINIIISLCETMKLLHKKSIAHRDIKPSNIFQFEGVWCLGDFGLVDYPEKEDVTLKNESVSAKWTIAPEMKRNASKSDPLPADVYSLSKTLWILITGEQKGFEGQYNEKSNISIKNYLRKAFFNIPIDELLTISTDNDPSKRPTIESFQEKLILWKKANKVFSHRNRLEWNKIQKNLFPITVPKRIEWDDINDIMETLNVIGSLDSLNHMFFPDGGGLDLTSTNSSYEIDCIELYYSPSVAPLIVKPKRLMFESFGKRSEWNYFRLETHELKAIFPDEVYNCLEHLTEIQPLHYLEGRLWEQNEFDDGEPLPENTRYVQRCLKGDFVIFSKSSIYNRNPGTYDGRHNHMDANAFRRYIENVINDLESGTNKTD